MQTQQQPEVQQPAAALVQAPLPRKIPPDRPPLEYDKVLQSILEGSLSPLVATTVSLNVLGVYSLPEGWKAKVTSMATGQEDPNRYEAECFGVKVEGGKLIPRQLTEEEKKAVEEAQSKKKPPKLDKKKQEEPSPEETAKLEAEKKAKEDLEAKRKAEWDALDSETQFYLTQEDPYKEPKMGFEAANDKGELVPNVKTVELKDMPLTQFVEYVNQDRGCWLYLDRLLPVEDEKDKKKPKPSKKGAQIERAFLETAGEPPKPPESVEEEPEDKGKKGKSEAKKPAAKEEKKKEEKKKEEKKVEEKKVEPAEAEAKVEIPKIFEPVRTYVHVKITLTQPINSELRKDAPKTPSELANKKPPVPKYPTTRDATEMYKSQLHSTVKALANEYVKLQESEKEGDKQASQQKSKEQQMTAKQQEKLRQKKKEEFVEELNRSGKYFALKERLKKAVVRVASEKYKKQAALGDEHKLSKDEFYSELYVYLLEQMHLAVDTIVKKEGKAIHDDIVASKEIVQREKELAMSKVFAESLLQRYERLYKEYERNLEFVTAEKYLLDIIKLNEKSVDAWVKYYKFSMKIGDVTKAEECLREALAIDGGNVDLRLALGGLLIQRKRYTEAAAHIKMVLRTNFTHVVANILIAILFELDQHKGLMKRHIEIAKRKKMRDLNLLPPKGSLKFDAPLPEPSRQLTNDEIDELFYGLIDFLIKNKQSAMAEKALSYVQNKESSRYLMALAKCYFVKGAHNDCLGVLNKLLEKEPKNQQALKYKGHTLFLQGNLFDSEEAYVCAIRTKPPPKSLTLYERLGQLYLKRKSWPDAQVVYYKCCAEPNMNSSPSWKRLGVSYLKLGKFIEAEDALTQANILDNNNAETWGYTTIMCLVSGKRKTQAEQTLDEAFRLNLYNVEILGEIADNYFKREDYKRAAECLERAVQVEPENGELLVRLGDCYMSLPGHKQAAVDAYVRALEFAEGETNKGKVAITLHDLLNADPALAAEHKELIEKLKTFIA